MRFVFRRLGFFLLTLWVALTLNFALPRLMPGNPALAIIGKFRGGISPQACDISGQWLPGVSRWAASWGGEYATPQRLLGLDGRHASRSFAAPDGFEGHLLFVREDLVATYAAGRPLVQLAWGERQGRKREAPTGASLVASLSGVV